MVVLDDWEECTEDFEWMRNRGKKRERERERQRVEALEGSWASTATCKDEQAYGKSIDSLVAAMKDLREKIPLVIRRYLPDGW
jgi:hypothetical protein